ncbi:transcriptional regulation of mitochondrial recombination-domain-containing protein [Aspergillus taichungensis]|uniref:Large ribosomal subunit protein mL67 n=1 Tax=Aspergillus taichungensis TaxID=482145 RepID=A0A2J5HMM0_9EURO|nr:transcriptional regulation of mitochondrial recombination-domain-containing protein [Aspergillus taichungensis]
MASAPKSPIQKILDPTKIGTWNVVRRPPIENHSLIQGRSREQNSNAFKLHQFKEGVRLRKAVNAITHGKNIFVYHNMRTNQVVYSLTRYLEKHNVLRQLVYHGKKTVPASLRKDMWVPYYSVHFNDAQVGLRAYHLLREFSLQRQLAPPRDMITISDQWLAQRRPRDPEAAKEFDEKYADKVGWLMEKKHRARALMDQKATSVADMAAVLAIQADEIRDGFARRLRGYLTPAARRRRREARKREQALAESQAARVHALEDSLSSGPASVEYKVEETPANTNALPDDLVKVLWADLYDAQFAPAWPDRVRHGELDQSRDHVMPGPHPTSARGSEILADGAFNEKKTVESPAEKTV